MKVIKNYEDAIYFLKHLPEDADTLDVIISYSADQVEINYTQTYRNVPTPEHIVNRANQYIKDIEKAINKEHENVKLEIPKTNSHSDYKVLETSFQAAIEFLENIKEMHINELYVSVDSEKATIKYIENINEPKLHDSNLVILRSRYIKRIKDAIVKSENEKKQFEESIRENPMPKVAEFFENLLLKLDEVDLSSSFSELKTKAGMLVEQQAYDKWNDSPFAQSVVEMKKILESLDSITEDSFLEGLKSKLQGYNRQVLALRESRNELNKLFKDMPNKEKFSVKYDEKGFVDVVQLPSVHLINRVHAYVTHGNDKIHIYECDAEGYYSIVNVEPGSPLTAIVNSIEKERIITLQEVPFERFTVTKSGNHIFAVEVIDKPVF